MFSFLSFYKTCKDVPLSGFNSVPSVKDWDKRVVVGEKRDVLSYGVRLSTTTVYNIGTQNDRFSS